MDDVKGALWGIFEGIRRMWKTLYRCNEFCWVFIEYINRLIKFTFFLNHKLRIAHSSLLGLFSKYKYDIHPELKQKFTLFWPRMYLVLYDNDTNIMAISIFIKYQTYNICWVRWRLVVGSIEHLEY